MRNQRVTDMVEGVELGDRRRNRRLEKTVEMLAARPQASIPEAAGCWAETLATYRLLDNDAISPERLVEGIGKATAKRCPATGRVLAVQDTTSLDYTGHHGGEGLGPLEEPTHQGLVMHTTLAVATEGVPLGVLDQRLWARDPEAAPSRQTRHRTPIEGKESAKWLQAFHASLGRVAGTCDVVTVADREADIYELFALGAELAGDWLIRARHDRKQTGDAASIEQVVAASPVLANQTVEVGRKPGQPTRQATVEVRAMQIQVAPPEQSGKTAKMKWYQTHPAVERLGPTKLEALTFGVVLVTEPAPAAGETPLHWLLLTSLPVTTAEEALTCVRYYRLRWLVERFHFVLKSGCRVEELQLETGLRLQRALVIYSVVAAWLLLSTYQARIAPDEPATTIMTDEAWQVLVRVYTPDRPLPPHPPSVREAIRLLARLGGFLARTGDGEPGVVTIWRGYRRLSELIFAWRIFAQISSSSPTDINCV